MHDKKTRYVSDNQQILRVDQEQTNPINGMIEKKILTKLDTLIDRFDVIVLSDYNKGLLTNSLIRKVIREQKEKKKL